MVKAVPATAVAAAPPAAPPAAALPAPAPNNTAAASASSLLPSLPNNTSALLVDASIPDGDSANNGIDAATTPTDAAAADSEDEEDNNIAGATAVKCCAKCPRLADELINCAFPGCTKAVHKHCYLLIINASAKALTAYEDIVFCTIKHHKDYTKQNSKESYSWTNDGPNGKNDPHHSEFRLVNILSSGDNYNQYRCPSGGWTKDKICAKWGNEIHAFGTQVHRTGAQVKNKVEQIETQFKNAYKWSHEETGTGLQQQDLENGTTTFKQAVSS
jgi:hypothetical protein